MKRIPAIFLALFCSIAFSLVASAETVPGIQSEAYVVMDAKSGELLFSRNADQKMYPASITKILTAALALDMGNPADLHTMSYEATHGFEWGVTHIALDTDEEILVQDLLNATMIESANDAANGLAEYAAGSLEAFPAIMNQKAAEIGASASHFVNPSGLFDKEHYTTARDMALITRWAIGVPGFREVFGAEDCRIAPTNRQPNWRNLGTHHMMIVPSKYYYEDATGGKLGWVPESQHTMVTLAERDGVELICVVMKTRNQYDKFEDTIRLFDAAFARYASAELSVACFANTKIPVLRDGKQVASISFPPQPTYWITRPVTLAKSDISVELQAPEQYQEGEEIAPTVCFYAPDRTLLGEQPITFVREESTGHPPILPAGSSGIHLSLSLPTLSFDNRILSAVVGTIFLLVCLLFAIRSHNLKKQKRRRLERQRAKQSPNRRR